MLGSKTITFGPSDGADTAARGAAEPVLAHDKSTTSSEAARRTIFERTRTMQATSPLSWPDHIAATPIKPAFTVVDRETYSPSGRCAVTRRTRAVSKLTR